MFPLDRPQLIANGNIRPNRFLTVVSGAGNFLLVVEATANTQFIVGISGNETRYAPGSPGDDGFIAIAGEPVDYFSEGQIGQLKLGTGGTGSTWGAYLTADASGQGVTESLTNAHYYGAIPLANGASGETVPVLVKLVAMPAA
jgi:hypothetical protein